MVRADLPFFHYFFSQSHFLLGLFFGRILQEKEARKVPPEYWNPKEEVDGAQAARLHLSCAV